MLYMASVKDENGKIQIMEYEYNSKKHFAEDLRGNGYKVRFIATAETFDAECEKYYQRQEKNKMMGKHYREMRKLKKELTNLENLINSFK